MSSQTSSAPKFSWATTLPWLLIFRSLSPAFSATVILFALMGVVASPMGWIVSERVFLGSEGARNADPILAEVAEINRSPYRSVFLATEKGENGLTVLGHKLTGPRLVFEQFVKPFYALFGSANTAREFLYFLVGSLWMLVVWSFVGLGITRVSLLRFTRNEHAGLDDAFEYALDYFATCFSALSMPIGFAFLLCIPTFVIGLILGFDFGALLIAAIWFLVLAIAFLLGLLLLGLMVSWPLVVCSVAAEGQNAFDAITRAFAYVFQRPVNYFFYLLVALLFGGVCWLAVHQFTESVIRLSFWSTSWGANRLSEDRINELKTPILKLRSEVTDPMQLISSFQPQQQQFQQQQPPMDVPGITQPVQTQSIQTQPIQGAGEVIVDSPQDQPVGGAQSELQMPGFVLEQVVENRKTNVEETWSLQTARKLIHFWTAFAKTIAAAFLHGLFWCMASAVYLLMRKDVDETEMDEIFMIDERRTYDLPPLKSDEHGIPQVQPLPLDDEQVPDQT